MGTTAGVSIRTRRTGASVVVSAWRPAEQLLAVTVDPAELPADPSERQRWMLARIVAAAKRQHLTDDELLDRWPWLTRLAEAFVAAALPPEGPAGDGR